MGQAEIVIAGVLVAVVVLNALALRLSVPYPIVLVIGGALLGFIPGMPTIKLNPSVVLVVFLPPLVYAAFIPANAVGASGVLAAVTTGIYIGVRGPSMCHWPLPSRCRSPPNSGAPFPDRDLIIFLTFAVIFATLVVQGLSLPTLIRRLGVTRDGSEDSEEIRARLIATKAALAQLDDLAAEEWTRDDTIDRLRRAYEYRKRRFAARAGQDRGRRLRGPLARLPAGRAWCSRLSGRRW